MTFEKSPNGDKASVEQCIQALHEKDRLNYSGKFIQGFVHNINGPLQNLTMLTEMLISGLELQDRIFKSNPGDVEKWSELLAKQLKRLTQMRNQVINLASDLRELMQLYEIERVGTEVDINILLTRIVQLFRADLFFKHQVKAELRLAKNLPHIHVMGKDIVKAVFHLFHNAITALRDAPEKELTIETEAQNGEITLRITDSGMGPQEGVEPDVLFELFESRWQTPNMPGVPEKHLGFGLYAARQILMPYGFSVNLERIGHTTTATIRMPLKDKSA